MKYKLLLITLLTSATLLACGSEEQPEVTIEVSTEAIEATETEEYTDAQGHIRDSTQSAVMPESKIETGELDEVLVAESDGEFYGQSGRYISDTLTDRDLRNKINDLAKEYLALKGITADLKFYMQELPDGFVLIEPTQGDGLLWYMPDTEQVSLTDDTYQFVLYTDNTITVKEADYISKMIYSLPADAEGYFFGTVKPEDSSHEKFVFTNTETHEDTVLTYEEVKDYAEHGPQYDD